MKKINLIFSSILALTLIFSASSCKPKDADIKTAVEKAIAADMTNATVTVEKGIVTINGECKDDACKTKCNESIKAIKGVKEVVNNCTLTPPPAPEVVIPTISAVEQSVKDALKDFPNVTYSLNEGGIVLGGEVDKAKLVTLMQALQGLNLKVDSKGLTKK